MSKRRYNRNLNMYKINSQFIDSSVLNDDTYLDYCNRFQKLALSIFEWVNLPESMNAQALERSLFFYGMASLLKDEKFGFINTNCASMGYLNIYGLPTKLNCFSYDYQETRTLYTGLPTSNEENDDECILVQNNWDLLPTVTTLNLFSYRLYMADRTCDVNISAQRTPVLLVVDEKQRLFMQNLYNQYNGNQPFIFGDKNQLGTDTIKSINTQAPFIADKIMEYKKEIFNDALTFLGINNILVDKKERMITDEVNSNNELINLNLQSYLSPRQLACKQFNEKFGFTGTDKEISVRVRSDLHNVIKNAESIVQDYKLDAETKKDILIDTIDENLGGA